MRQIAYSDIVIDKDPRIPVVKKLLSGIISKLDLEETIVTVMPDNTVIGVCKLTTVFVANINECVPGYMMMIDQRTFKDDIIEKYHIEEDEYILFNQEISSLYLNIREANNMYFYNLPKYQLIDKIENIGSYEEFQYYLNLKSESGSKFFKGFCGKFIIPIWTKFPNIAKSDIASLYVYRFDNDSDLVVWKVKKKKFNKDIYTIFRVLRLL